MKNTKYVRAAAWFAAALLPVAAKATTIETFSFTQGGFSDSGELSGSFTGALESNGSIELADITAFSAEYISESGQATQAVLAQFPLSSLDLFSFEPGADGPNSSFDLFATLGTGADQACSGAAAGLGLCGFSSNAAGLFIIPDDAQFFDTTQIATVSLVSPPPALMGNPSAIGPPASTTPEPSTFAMIGSAFILLGLLRRSQFVNTKYPKAAAYMTEKEIVQSEMDIDDLFEETRRLLDEKPTDVVKKSYSKMVRRGRLGHACIMRRTLPQRGISSAEEFLNSGVRCQRGKESFCMPRGRANQGGINSLEQIKSVPGLMVFPFLRMLGCVAQGLKHSFFVDELNILLTRQGIPKKPLAIVS